jgi:rhodanese-related sulfurtransferase
VICAAHDYSNSFVTLWGSERTGNPLLELALDDTHPLGRPLFLAAKREYDQGLGAAEEKAQGIVCGVVRTDLEPASEISIPPGGFREFLAKHEGDVKVIDVREPWEWTVSTCWESLGFSAPPENIPLSRFVNLVGDLVSGKAGLQTRVALLCRSGSRSLHAARSLRRLGFKHVWSLEGGLAYGLGERD